MCGEDAANAEIEVDHEEGSPELHYVIRTVEGARHAGWYRLLDEHQLQVMSEGRCVTVRASEGSLEDQAREVLKEIATASHAQTTGATSQGSPAKPETS